MVTRTFKTSSPIYTTHRRCAHCELHAEPIFFLLRHNFLFFFFYFHKNKNIPCCHRYVSCTRLSKLMAGGRLKPLAKGKGGGSFTSWVVGWLGVRVSRVIRGFHSEIFALYYTSNCSNSSKVEHLFLITAFISCRGVSRAYRRDSTITIQPWGKVKTHWRVRHV